MAFDPRGRDVLALYPYVVVRVTCHMCPSRRGHFRLARLAERFGAEITLDELLVRLTADCPYQRGLPGPEQRMPRKYMARCEAAFPDLAGFTPPRPPDLPVALLPLRVVQGGRR